MSKLLETLCLQTMFAAQTKNINNMKNLKSIFLATFLTIGAFSTTVFTSCEKDACDDIVCANGGTCTEGICACPSGYEGTLCETVSRSKFTKSWAAADQQGANNLVYNCVIANGTAITSVLIDDTFSDDYFVNNVNATVNGNTITIPSQEPDADGYKVAGTGTLTSGKISWNYTITEVSSGSVLTYTGLWQ
jgi:hypothetical protein